jgi:hypothetical protein
VEASLISQPRRIFKVSESGSKQRNLTMIIAKKIDIIPTKAEIAFDAGFDYGPDPARGRLGRIARRREEAEKIADIKRHHAKMDRWYAKMSPAKLAEIDASAERYAEAQRREKSVGNVVPIRPAAAQSQFAKDMKAGKIPSPTGSKEPPVTNVAPLAVQSAADLRSKNFAPVRYIVPGYVAEGCTILAGRPKVGKSWFMLDIGLAVAAGGEVLGTKAEEGDVLYLGLEDNERRLKSRIGKILGPLVEWPKRFSYATTWARQHEGGLDKIRQWIESVPQPRLIVVDVLARFRAPQNGQSGQYEADYAAIQGLQAIASEKNLAIVIVHHLRKMAADGDPFDKVSGTLGLSGAADTVLIFDRDGQGTVLYGRGRDIEEIETAVTFDRDRCRWQALGTAAEVRRSDGRKAVLDALSKSDSPMSRSDIALATGMTPNNLDQMIWKMTRAGEIIKVARGVYRISVDPTQRLIPPPPPQPR